MFVFYVVESVVGGGVGCAVGVGVGGVLLICVRFVAGWLTHDTA